ncbi:MAG: tRNA pseudouridine(38-40) synthase TruA [Gillisia sp.]
MRYFVELAYNGKQYHGWQNQPDAISVQEVVEKVLRTVFQKKISVTGAGRTDSGVHASQYFAHFDTEEIEDFEKFIFKLNSILPEDIAVFNIFMVCEDAHARFDASARSYEYHVVQHKDPFKTETAYYVKNELDMEKMNRAATQLLGFSDFKCFSKSRTDVRTYNCKISSARWERRGNELVFCITADRFLRNMVRAIVGTLLEIGLGKMEENELQQIIKSRDRQKAGTSVPAKGLFLTRIEYPTSIIKN